MNSPKLHIVHISNSLDIGGVPKLILGMISSSALSNCKQSVICLLGARGDLFDEYKATGASLYSCRVRWPARVSFLPFALQEWFRERIEKTFSWRLAWLLKMIKADVVHVHFPRSIDAIAHSCVNLCDLPVVWSIHGKNLYFDGTRGYVLNIATQTFIRSGYSWVTGDSKILAQGFLQHFPEAEKIVRVVHAGADIENFQKQNTRNPAWRKELGISENALVFGSCGRLSRVKGFDIFLESAALLLRQGVDAHFVISGKGDMYAPLSAEAAKLGISDRFHLLGFVEDLPRLHKEFDVFVLSSRSEGFPLSLIEALASGLPCVATDVSGVREMFGEYGGIIIEPESPNALMNAMLQMSDIEVRRKFALGARAIGQKYSYESCATEFLDLYLHSAQVKNRKKKNFAS